LIVTNIADVLTTVALKWGIDSVTAGSAEGLALACATYLGLMLICTAGRYGWRRLWPRFWTWAATDLRRRALSQSLQLGPRFHQRRSTGEMMSVLTNDIQSFRTGVGSGLLLLIDTVVYIILIIPLMLSISWVWTLQVLILLPLLPPFVRLMTQRIRELARTQSERLAEVSSVAQEIIVGNRAIRAAAAEDVQLGRFNEQSRQYEQAVLKLSRADAVFQPSLEFFVSMGAVILLWYSSSDVMKGEMSLGALVAFHDLLRRLIWPVEGLALSLSFLQQGRAAHGRIRDLMHEQSEHPIIPPTGERAKRQVFRELVVRGGELRPADSAPVLIRNIDLTVRPSQKLALVGPVGSGKSSLLYGFLGLCPLLASRLEVNGIDIKNWSTEERASFFVLVSQEAPLFSESIWMNLQRGSEGAISRSRLLDLVKLVRLDDEIVSMPDGFDSLVGERGVTLSGGQKQRLTLARGLARAESIGSGVLLLDDCLSAVDQETEQEILEGLTGWLRQFSNFALVYATHRPEAIRSFDRVIRIERQMSEIGVMR
jgi:ATP-binding cassette subfamily B protein